MTPQESAMLNDLVTKIKQTQLPEKDAEAEQFLKQNLATIPDSLYILAQTVLVQNIAIEQAKSQIDQLQDRLQEAESQLQAPPPPPPPQQHTSFLGSLLGRRDAPPPPQQSYPQPGFPARPSAAPEYYPPAPAYPPNYGSAPPPSAGSSFLRSAATTAAGVAAGALAFEGVESLLHGFGHGGGGFGGGEGFGGGGFGERPGGETIINNYYDDPNQNTGGEEHGREASFDGGDRFADDDRGGQFNDAGYDSGDSQDLSSLDDQDGGDLGNSGDFDDGGGFDSGDDSNVV